jgi:hypothetical protein
MIATNQALCTVRDVSGSPCGFTAVGQGVGEYCPTVCAYHAKCMVFCGFQVKLLSGRLMTLGTWRRSDSLAAAKDLEQRYRPVSECAYRLRAVNHEIRQMEKASTVRGDNAKELVRLYDLRDLLDRQLVETFQAVS